MTILVGADPELFVCEGDVISVGVGCIGGSKREPLAVDKGAVQEDNVLGEFNIHPASSRMQFVDNIKTVWDQLNSILAGSGKSTKVIQSHEYTPREIRRAGPQAMEFGCDPDYNAWTGTVNETPRPATGLRTAGGHVHIGYDNPSEETSYAIAQVCDYLLGLPSVLIDQDGRRKEMYGKAGACRIKPYGVEYRVLSNFWLADSSYMEWVYDQAIRAAIIVLSNEQHVLFDAVCPDQITEAINANDKDAAALYVKVLELEVPYE